MNGCSKSYAMTGWRIGFAGAPVALIKAMDKLQSQSTSNPSSISQAAALAASTGPQDCIAEMVATYRQRRDMVVEMLNAASGLSCHKPEGAFYVFPSVRGCWKMMLGREADRERRKFRAGAAGGSRGSGGARWCVPGARAFPAQLRR